MVFRCLYSSPEKPGQIVPPFLRCKCSFAPDLPFAQRSLVQRGFQFINIRPDLFPKIIALYVLGVAFPNALRPHRADIAIRLFRIVNPPQPSGQPSKIPQLQFFPLRAAIQIVFLIVDNAPLPELMDRKKRDIMERKGDKEDENKRQKQQKESSAAAL